MGKSATRRAPTEPTPPALPPAAAATITDPAADALIAESRERNPKPPRTIVHRIDPETGDRKWCVEAVTDIITPEFIAKRFGAGRYYLTHRKADTGSYQYAGHETIDIDESVRAETASTSAPLPESGPTAVGESGRPAIASGGNILERAMEAGVLQLLQQMSNQNQLTLAMVERINKGSDRGPGILEVIAALGPLLAPVLAELVKRKGKDPLEMATQLATLMKDTNKTPGAEQLVTMLEKGVSLATKLGDRGEPNSSLFPVLGDGIRVLGDIVTNIIAQRRAGAGELAAGDGSGQPSLALVPDHDAAPAQGSGMPERLWVQAASAHLPALLSASRFVPAVAAAETVAANLTPAALDDLLEDIQDETAPGFAARLVQRFPAAANVNPQWFNILIQTLLEDNAGPEDEAPANPPTRAAK